MSVTGNMHVAAVNLKLTFSVHDFCGVQGIIVADVCMSYMFDQKDSK